MKRNIIARAQIGFILNGTDIEYLEDLFQSNQLDNFKISEIYGWASGEVSDKYEEYRRSRSRRF